MNESDPSQGMCTLVDVVPWMVDWVVQERITLTVNPADCRDCHFVHPGQHKVLSQYFSQPVADAHIELNLIAYSDGKVETSGEQGAANAPLIASYRQQELKQVQELVDMAKQILADPAASHPAASMIEQLASRAKSDDFMAGELRQFKKPEWWKGNNTEFIPSDERGYLAKFLAEQQMKVAEFSKYQIQGVGQ